MSSIVQERVENVTVLFRVLRHSPLNRIEYVFSETNRKLREECEIFSISPPTHPPDFPSLLYTHPTPIPPPSLPPPLSLPRALPQPLGLFT